MQMSYNTSQIEPRRNGEVMQMRFAQPRIGGAAQARGAHGLRDRPFDARPQGILLHKGGAALHGAPLVQGRMHLERHEGECAALVPARTLGAYRTDAAGGLRKADDHRGMLTPIRGVRPAHTLVPLRTGRHLRVPIDCKVAAPTPLLLAPFPTRVLAAPPNNISAPAGLP